jgi:hypothetical protein
MAECDFAASLGLVQKASTRNMQIDFTNATIATHTEIQVYLIMLKTSFFE